MDKNDIKFDLIVTIISKGYADEVVAVAKKAGAEGSTILNGRGSGIHEKAKLFGMLIEPEKEIILILVPNTITDRVLEAITTAANLEKPHNGIAFVINVDKTVGICHLSKLIDSMDTVG